MSNNNAPQQLPEKYLELSDGRTLAYADTGDPSSSCLVIFFHGVFGVGSAPQLQPFLMDKNVHYVAPTLAGWGTSSPRKKDVPYHVNLASDITQLINHLHPHDLNLKIYIAGGSYGTVPAQMLYGAPFDVFPYGRDMVACLLMAPFSPFKLHKEYAKGLDTQSYISVGPPSQSIPFKIIPRMTAAFMKSKMTSVDKCEIFIRQTLFDPMGPEEKAKFREYREENNKKEGEVERSFAENVYRSVQETWDGFFEVSDTIHCDWGFSPASLDDQHNQRPILIVSSAEDTLAPNAMAKWLAANYKNAHLRSINGGHLAALFHLNDLWKQLFEL